MEAGEGLPDPEEAVRFEDLTVDDDLPILERIVRYTRSQIALQRLVHVKMLGETAELAGMLDTQDVIVPLLTGLVTDAESVIRQHLAAQLLTVAIVCMVLPPEPTPDGNNSSSSSGNNNPLAVEDDVPPILQAKEWIDHPEKHKDYEETGYHIVAEILIGQVLTQLIRDQDVDVRRAAADCLTGLALQIRPGDISTLILPIPLQLAADHKPPSSSPTSQQSAAGASQPVKKTEADQQSEEWRMTAANLLAELGGAVAEQPTAQEQATSWGTNDLVPAVLEFTTDASFRVRRAAAQALPRILGAATVTAVIDSILPAFERLSRDDLYRVRKSTGECLVDMSRSLVILASLQKERTAGKKLHEARRTILIPIADRLIQDEHKMVRQGMMQFLGPFMASFYPFFHSSLDSSLPATSESDGSNHMGIVAQFFPHATSMVSRLNSSQNAVTTAPTPVLIDPVLEDTRLEIERLQHALPLFLQASRRSAHALRAVRLHRLEQAPPHKDLEAIVNGLLDYFAALAIVQTGDENTDAEMRVYCAYSFPAVVLLLGPENWPGALKTCFLTLLNPSYAEDEDDNDDAAAAGDDANNNKKEKTEPPLPVKRCLASSLHTVAHVLGPTICEKDILPVFVEYFLRDSDEAVRLNIIRGFPTFLSILPAASRPDLFTSWSKVIHGEDCLGAKKRSATNPMVLNWRQRNYLARSLPDLAHLLPPDLIHAHVWPICQQLLIDSVSLVRDDALWTVPILFKVYTPDTIAAAQWSNVKRSFSPKAATLEIVAWFKEHILKLKDGNSSTSNLRRASSSLSQSQHGGGAGGANFAERQLFCRLCGTIGLALRLNEEIRATGKKDLAAALGESFAALFLGSTNTSHKAATPLSASSSSVTNTANNSSSSLLPAGMMEEPSLDMPFQKLSTSEAKQLKRLLEDHLLPLALIMKDDRIRNVRVTLLRVLQILPAELRESSQVKPVLQTLLQEVLTWESFGEEATMMPPPTPTAAAPTQQPPAAPQGAAAAETPKKNRRGKKQEKVEARPASQQNGPVDLDEDVSVTPTNSRDDDDAGDDDDYVEEVVEDDEEYVEEVAEDESGKKKKSGGKPSSKKGRRKSEPNQDSDEDSEGGDAPEDEKGEQEAKPSGGGRVDLGNFMANEESSGKDKRKGMRRSKSGRSLSSRGSRGGGSTHSPKPKKGSSKSSKKPSTKTVQEEDGGGDARSVVDDEDQEGWKTVMFDDGPIGLQLEPTADDQACRVYGFLETGNARKSGKIQLGDVIVKVNNVVVRSYDETVDLLKRGGRRAVTFRSRLAIDDYVVDESGGGAGSSRRGSGHHHEQQDGANSSDDNNDAATQEERGGGSSSSKSRSTQRKRSTASSSTSRKKSSGGTGMSSAAGSSSSSKLKTKKSKKKSGD